MTTVLTTCKNSFEANLIKGLLATNGIHCFLINENFSNLLPNFAGMMGTGIQIFVEETDLIQARNLISSNQNLEQPRCPNCNSYNVNFGIGQNKIGRIFTIILSLLVWIPFGNIQNTYYCKDCKTEFKPE